MCVKMRKKLVFLLLFLSIFDVESQYDDDYDESYAARDLDEGFINCPFGKIDYGGHQDVLHCNINGI